MTEPLLSLRHLVTAFETDEGYLRAVDDVSFDVLPGRTLGIVGESGCGKSVTSLSIMRLIPSPPGFIEGGEALFEGRDLFQLPESEMRSLRGNEISMIFQEPMTSLNPVTSPEREPPCREGPRDRAAGFGRNPRSCGADRLLSAYAVWWHAAARDDRDGACV
jgi:ABC-type glutathione transport system ATPase component